MLYRTCKTSWGATTMSVRIMTALVAAMLCTAAAAQTAASNTALADIGFLLGRWISNDGKVADTGGTSKGSSVITAEANGAVLLRRDHTDLFDRSGKSSGGFDQIMMIYPEGGSLHADYSDGTHVIHYDSATIVPGHSVTFTSVHQPGAPVFRLTYELTGPAVLAISFAMAPPGQSEFQTVASGISTGQLRSPQ